MPRPILMLAIVAGLVPVASFADSDDEFFENHVRPLLVSQCVDCHSGMTPEGDLDLSTAAGFASGGMNGPAVDLDHVNKSQLLDRLVTNDDDLLMPPGERLAENQIAVIRQWIERGAKWPAVVDIAVDDDPELSHWAFQPVTRPTPPEVSNEAWCWTPVDQFIQQKYEERGVQPVGEASLTTWLRRISLDLTGLPPTPEELAAYGQSQGSKSAVVELLLSSKAYGERQARRWLDVARYADTSGDGTDTPIPEARYYRDWVINAFNNDRPYDEFLIEQLAGDLVAKANPDDPNAYQKIIATGYIALSRRFGNSKFAEMHQVIDDTIDTVGKSTMGLSLGCARCHHHKFDPVTMEDYYGLYGYFASTQYPHAGTEHQKEREGLPAIDVPKKHKDRFESAVAWGVSDKPKPSDERIRVAGDPRKKGDVAPRGFLGFITAGSAEIPHGTSGRLQFAEWVTSPDHPLTARVMVNRIWQSHFGKGLVANSNNFGRQSAPPSHPELLDYLASGFIDSGWSVKHIHRLIVSSHVYSLASSVDDSQAAIDEPNETLWRFPRQRMDAETFRDSMLAVSGLLEEGDGGRHPFKPTDKLKYSQGRPFNEIFDHNRRSVYLMTPRLNRHPMMALFDGADANVTTGQRAESTVPLQSLFVMNGEFVRTNAASFADRVTTEFDNEKQAIEHAFQLAYARTPKPHEREMVTEYLTNLDADASPADRQRAWTSVARVLLGANEFVYID